MLRRPDDHKLHDYILDNMDLDKFTEPKLKYEILCLLGHFKGCKDATFLKLFNEQVWLMGQNEPTSYSISIKHKTARFDPLLYVYPDASAAHVDMSLFLGNLLI